MIISSRHSWTSEAYEELSILASSANATLRTEPGEWARRFKLVKEYLTVLGRLYLHPRGQEDASLSEVVSLAENLHGLAVRESSRPTHHRSPELVLQFQRAAATLFAQYNPYKL